MNESLQQLETKIENQGATPQGKVSAVEWNVLVAAVKQLDSSGISDESLKKYLQQYQYITKPELSDILEDATPGLSGVVNTSGEQDVFGVKNFVNGLKLSDKLIRYIAEKNVFVFPGSILAEGGIAWNTKLEGFEEQTVTAAVQVDWDTIGKNENGELYVIGGTSGGGVADSVAWENVTGRPTKLSQFTDDVVKGNYLPMSGGTIQAYHNSPLVVQNIMEGASIGFGLQRWGNFPAYLAYYGGIDWRVTNEGWYEGYPILHSGNYSNYVVSLTGEQDVTGIKNFVNGIKVGGALVTYNASKNTFVFPANAIFEGGVAWNSKIDGFDVPTIMDAVVVDGVTITKEDGKLKVIGDLSGGIDETQLGDYLTRNSYAKRSDIPSLSGYATESFVVTRGYITSASLPTKLSQLTDDVVEGNYLSLAMGGIVNAPVTLNGKLTMSSAMTTSEDIVINTEKYNNVTWSRGLIWRNNASEYGNLCYVSIGGHKYFNIAHGAYNSLTGLRILGNGYVSIGGDIANERLHVFGNARVTGNVAAQSVAINGGLITYDASLKAFVLNGNLVVKGGIAWDKQNS